LEEAQIEIEKKDKRIEKLGQTIETKEGMIMQVKNEKKL